MGIELKIDRIKRLFFRTVGAAMVMIGSSIIIMLCLTLLPDSPATEQDANIAEPAVSVLSINGTPITFQTFWINGYEYFKLRDLAFALNGTDMQFAVEWDSESNEIHLISGQPYVSVGGEMRQEDLVEEKALYSSSRFFLDGSDLGLSAYYVNDSNLFYLCCFMDNFGIELTWDDITKATALNKKTDSNALASNTYTFPRIAIDQNLVKVSDKLPVRFSVWVKENFSHYNPDESNSAIQVLSYPGKSLGYEHDLEWFYAEYYPKFEKLVAPGADTIRDYYAKKYEQGIIRAKEFSFGKDEVSEDGSSYTNYHYLGWDSYEIGNYLVVTWFQSAYTGGANAYYYEYVEQFDLRTGQLLTKEDVFGNIEDVTPILNLIISRHLMEEHDWKPAKLGKGRYVNVAEDTEFIPLIFRLESEGIVFIYNKYAFPGPERYHVFVPYEELRQVLVLDI